MGGVKNAYIVLISNRDAERPLGKPRHKLKYNVIMDIKKIGWEGVNWVNLAPDRDN
jgi:hypothetical protein